MCSESLCCSPDTATPSEPGALRRQPSVSSSLEEQLFWGGKCSHPPRDPLAAAGVSRVQRLAEIYSHSHSGAPQLPPAPPPRVFQEFVFGAWLLAAAQERGEFAHAWDKMFFLPSQLAKPSLVFYSVRYGRFILQGFSPGWGRLGRVFLAQRDSAVFPWEHRKAGDRELFPGGLQ